jgi:hypothetical protein
VDEVVASQGTLLKVSKQEGWRGLGGRDLTSVVPGWRPAATTPELTSSRPAQCSCQRARQASWTGRGHKQG